ncbi:MAG: galactokinase [Actinomycetes bacterium]
MSHTPLDASRDSPSEPLDGGFRETFGRAPTHGFFAPGRVTLIGDHTDYTGGWVLPLAIQLRTAVHAALRDDDRIRVTSTAFIGPVHERRTSDLTPNADSWASYVEGSVWVLRDEGVAVPGFEMAIASEIPIGAGLSSSAALTCATLSTLLDLCGARWPAPQVARAARRVENDYLGAPVGVMDPMVVMLSRAGHALLFDTRSLERELVALPLHGNGLELLVVDTGAAHSTSGEQYADRVRQCAEATEALRLGSLRELTSVEQTDALDDPVLRARARHVVTENQRVLECAELLRSGRVGEIGPLLLASHASLRDDFAVSTPELDRVVEAAVSAGALGARLTGAGFGGCAVVLIDRDAVDEFASALDLALTGAGDPSPTVLAVVPSGPCVPTW